MRNNLKFWTPESGAIGGIVFAFVMVAIGILLFPPLLKFAIWWQSFWGV